MPKSKKKTVTEKPPVGADLTEPLSNKEIAEREAEAERDNPPEVEKPVKAVKKVEKLAKEISEAEGEHIMKERGDVLVKTVNFAREHAAIARANDHTVIYNHYKSLEAMAMNLLKATNKPYFTKKVK